MHQPIDLELIPRELAIPHPTFASHEEYEKWREEFIETVRPELERLARCRRESEREARNRPLYRSAA